MSAIVSQIASLTIVYSSVYRATDRKYIKAPRHWPLCGEFTGDRWIPRTNGQENVSIWWRHHVPSVMIILSTLTIELLSLIYRESVGTVRKYITYRSAGLLMLHLYAQIYPGFPINFHHMISALLLHFTMILYRIYFCKSRTQEIGQILVNGGILDSVENRLRRKCDECTIAGDRGPVSI